jgi:hypothetical protein
MQGMASEDEIAELKRKITELEREIVDYRALLVDARADTLVQNKLLDLITLNKESIKRKEDNILLLRQEARQFVQQQQLDRGNHLTAASFSRVRCFAIEISCFPFIKFQRYDIDSLDFCYIHTL